jgi:hypothetical protein
MRAALLALLLVGCGGAHEVDLTIVVDPTIGSDQIALVRTLEIAVLGAEPSDIRYPITRELADRKTTWIYKSKGDGALQFQVTARGDGRVLIAAGKSRLLTPGGSVVSDTIHLGTDPPNPDKRRLGEACTAGVDTCASGFCVDGVCCDSACDGACNTCDGLQPGTCQPAAAGTNPRKMCTSDPSMPCALDGTCDGAGQCRIAPVGKVCAPPTCANGMATSTSLCDGAGTCNVPSARACAPYACNAMATACATICTAAAGCAPSVSCVAGSCGKVGQGGRCFGGGDCQNGRCIDGYCCDALCGGSCMSCKEPGHEGTCTQSFAGEDDPHKVCKDGGATSCAQNGKCDGMGGCQNYAAGTVCAHGGCNADKSAYVSSAVCAGDGSPCPTQAITACAPYLCTTSGAPGCQVSCGECTYYDPGKGPPFSDRCATGTSCVEQCLGGSGQFVCQ